MTWKLLRKIIIATLITMSVSFNIVSASYVILKFSGGNGIIDKINMYTSRLAKTTTALNNVSSDLVTAKENGALSNLFLKSITSINSLNPISDPPYTEVGQIFWDSTNKTLVSTNGTSRYIWVGSAWVPINPTNLIVGSNLNVSQLISKNPGQLPSNGLKINSSGQINTSVQVSNVTARPSFIILGAVIKVTQSNTTISNIHWDTSRHFLVGTTRFGQQVTYSINPDKYGSYWSDAILQ